MIFLRKLLSFFIILVITLYIGYFTYLNTDRIFVIVPGLGEQTISKAFGFLTSFTLGAIFSCLFFGFDFIKKSLEVRGLKKELKDSSSVKSTAKAKFTPTVSEPKKDIFDEPLFKDDISTSD